MIRAIIYSEKDSSKTFWPLALHLTVGEAADCKSYDTLIALPERTPQALLACIEDGAKRHQGYDTDAIRADLANRNSRPLFR